MLAAWGANFFNSSLAANETREYKQAVSSQSSGGEHESTGLRAKQKLNTPLSRCASLAKHAQSARFRVDKATYAKGEPPGSPFCLLSRHRCRKNWLRNRQGTPQLLIRAVLVVPVMTPLAVRAVLLMVTPIVRRSCVRTLRGIGRRSRLRRGRRFLRTNGDRWRCCEQQTRQDTFHGRSPEN